MTGFSISASVFGKLISCAMLFFSFSSLATGGISIQGTRIIYPQDSRQESVSVRNSSPTDSFLVQSWVENADGKKSDDFIVTPPLYLSNPYNENTLRLIYVGDSRKKDQETLYYYISKAIPSIGNDKKEGRENNSATIRIAAATRIKLFVRPEGMNFPLDKVSSSLKFKRTGNTLKITNPSPYYVTLTDMKIGVERMEGIMLSPRATSIISLSENSSNSITFKTINDYGALSSMVTATIGL